MSNKNFFKYSVIFKELDKLAEEPGTLLSDNEIQEYNEIRILREIVQKIQTPEQNYLTST